MPTIVLLGSWTTTPTNKLHFMNQNTTRAFAAKNTQLMHESLCSTTKKKAATVHTTTLVCGTCQHRQTEEYCRGYISKLTDLQSKNLLANLLNSAAWSEEERWVRVQLQWLSCICTVYTMYLLFGYNNNNLQFCENKLLLVIVTSWEVTSYPSLTNQIARNSELY